MKILVFSPYYPPHIGGLESHSDEFNKYLSQRGVNITVFTPRLPQDAPEMEIKYNGVEIIRFPAFEIVSNYPLPKLWTKKYWELKKKIKQKKFNIIISRTRFFITSVMAILLAKSQKIKLIHIEHGSDFVQLSSKLKTFIARIYDHLLGRLVFRNSDLNISISKAVRKFVYRFDRRKSPIIRRGLNFEEIDKIRPNISMREKYKNKIFLSFAGRLYKWKGVENSILAIKSLPAEYKEKIIFFIIGDGEDFEKLNNLIKGEKSILMLGSLSRKETIAMFKISSIYLHSSMAGGGLSTSLLEAMYCGCAVIATKNEGADEIVKDNENGLLIKKTIPGLIKNKIEELLADEERRKKIAQEAGESIRKKFSWEDSINKYFDILKNVK